MHSALIRQSDWMDLPRRIGLRGFQVSIIEYEKAPGLITVTLWHPEYTKRRRRRRERTLERINAHIRDYKPVGIVVDVRLWGGPKPAYYPDWQVQQERPAQFFINGRRVGYVEHLERKVTMPEPLPLVDFHAAATITGTAKVTPEGEKFFKELLGREYKFPLELSRRRLTGEWIERCDVCGKKLDQMAGEDFFVEDRDGSHVYCAEHWKERNDDGRDNQGTERPHRGD